MLSRRLVLPALVGVIAASFVPQVFAVDAPPPAYPTAGCFTLTDASDDASFDGVAPDDADLDMTGLALETTSTSLLAFIKVDALISGPGYTDGHRFTVDFTFNKHVFSMSGSAYSDGTGAVRDGLASTGQAGHVTQLGVDVPPIDPTAPDPRIVTDKGFVDSGLKVTFDTQKSWVVMQLPIADIEKNGGAKFAGDITAVDAKSGTDEYAVSSIWDTVEGTPDPASWTIGDNKCFGDGTGGGVIAPSTGLSYTGDTKVQYGDTAALAAALVDADGKPVSGASITFAIGKLQTSAKTNTKGIAAATLTPKLTAGRYSLVTSYAGKDEGGAVNTPFVVSTGRTVLDLTTTSKKVTASLSGHQKQPIAGQRITWTVNGKSAGSGTTNKRGLATLTHVHKGDHVTAVFKSVKGKYAGSHAKTTV